MKLFFAIVFLSFALLFGCINEQNQPTQVGTATSQQETQTAQQTAPPTEPQQPAVLQLATNECFYNSQTQELSCGSAFVAVHGGIEYNISTSPSKVNICGLTGFVPSATVGRNDSKAYLTYIVKDEDSRFTLDENSSNRGVGALAYNGRCNQFQ